MEVLIAASIGVAMMSAVLFVFIRGNQMFVFDSCYLDTQKNVRLALDNISQDTRRAKDVVSTAIGSIPASTPLQLVLEVSSIDALGDTIAGSNDYFMYALNGTTLEKTTWITTGSSRTPGTKNISSNISSLAFGYFPTPAGATRTTISITSTATVMNKTHTRTLSTSVKLRNK